MIGQQRQRRPRVPDFNPKEAQGLLGRRDISRVIFQEPVERLKLQLFCPRLLPPALSCEVEQLYDPSGDDARRSGEDAICAIRKRTEKLTVNAGAKRSI